MRAEAVLRDLAAAVAVVLSLLRLAARVTRR